MRQLSQSEMNLKAATARSIHAAIIKEARDGQEALQHIIDNASTVQAREVA